MANRKPLVVVYVVELGVALSTTELLIEIKSRILL
jgi:hypothetical protein